MKKVFKKLKFRDLLFFIIGGIVIGTIGITATTYVLESNQIQYDGNKSVQQAIDELFVKAENCGKGSSETLPVGDVSVVGYKIIIPYTGSYPTIRCVYGTDEKYGNEGTINNNTCYFKGTNSDQTLYYKIVATDNTGKVYEYSGSNITGTCDNFDDDNNCITKTTYITGDAIKLGGYNWHVISDTGTNITLLMDAGQLGDYSDMAHASSETTYSWKYSLIRNYLNSIVLTDLQSKITNEIVSTEICADPSRYIETTYGGYLISELTALDKTSSCITKVTDKVRLISPAEYYNMSPKYTSADSNYPNVGNYIKKISISSDYASWLYCSSCGSSSYSSYYGNWWTMGSVSESRSYSHELAYLVSANGSLSGQYADINNYVGYYGVRPVITIVK